MTATASRASREDKHLTKARSGRAGHWSVALLVLAGLAGLSSCAATDTTTVTGLLKLLGSEGYECTQLQELALPENAVGKEAATCVMNDDELLVITFATEEHRAIYEDRVADAAADFAAGRVDESDFGSHPEVEGVGTGDSVIGDTWYLSGIQRRSTALAIVGDLEGVRLEDLDREPRY